ncbi:hypothetical protein BKA70DRAFT_1364470 [Coprinopsis sp. MPI-PUGE-AT-0042]|nr:hypothetical protein BKA70DRAFT_1364470 [Coprinopsis sp. MPI-PUGE-AT-0042]
MGRSRDIERRVPLGSGLGGNEDKVDLVVASQKTTVLVPLRNELRDVLQGRRVLEDQRPHQHRLCQCPGLYHIFSWLAGCRRRCADICQGFSKASHGSAGVLNKGLGRGADCGSHINPSLNPWRGMPPSCVHFDLFLRDVEYQATHLSIRGTQACEAPGSSVVGRFWYLGLLLSKLVA